jgi:predicted RNase H-like HicB family nuclease
MKYQVFVESQSDCQFIASVVGVPNCVVEGTSREEAIAKAKMALTEKIAHGEFVSIEIDSQLVNQKSNPWLKHLGIFKDDPTFDDFLEKVTAYRQQANEESEG